MPNALLLLPIVSGARQWLFTKEELGAEPGCPKLQQARRAAGLSRSLAVGIAAQGGCGSLELLRAVW